MGGVPTSGTGWAPGAPSGRTGVKSPSQSPYLPLHGANGLGSRGNQHPPHPPSHHVHRAPRAAAVGADRRPFCGSRGRVSHLFHRPSLKGLHEARGGENAGLSRPPLPGPAPPTADPARPRPRPRPRAGREAAVDQVPAREPVPRVARRLPRLALPPGGGLRPLRGRPLRRQLALHLLHGPVPGEEVGRAQGRQHHQPPHLRQRAHRPGPRGALRPPAPPRV